MGQVEGRRFEPTDRENLTDERRDRAFVPCGARRSATDRTSSQRASSDARGAGRDIPRDRRGLLRSCHRRAYSPPCLDGLARDHQERRPSRL